MVRRFLAVLPLVVIGGACASHVRYDYEGRHTTIETEPAGARVYQVTPGSGKPVFLGMTPVRDQPVLVPTGMNLPPRPDEVVGAYTQLGTVRVRIEKPGYVTYEGNLATGEKETIKHRIVLEPTK